MPSPFNAKFKFPSPHIQHLHHPPGCTQEMCILGKGRHTLITPIAYQKQGETSDYLEEIAKANKYMKTDCSFCDL